MSVDWRKEFERAENAISPLRAELERTVEAGMRLRESHIQLDADNRLLRAELSEAKGEADHNYRLISRQGRLLSATVNTLRGDPPEDTLWSHHDVAELASATVARLREATDIIKGSHYFHSEDFAEDPKDLDESCVSPTYLAHFKRLRRFLADPDLSPARPAPNEKI
jgi:hypothetical protein